MCSAPCLGRQADQWLEQSWYQPAMQANMLETAAAGHQQQLPKGRSDSTVCISMHGIQQQKSHM